MTKICPVCKKNFVTYNATKFCSIKCRVTHQKGNASSKRQKNESICWSCKNACGSCPWSSSFTPVEGWNAIPTKVKGNNYTGEIIDSYHVISCPMYKNDYDND